jgi:hypothetical protein
MKRGKLSNLKQCYLVNCIEAQQFADAANKKLNDDINDRIEKVKRKIYE